MADQHPEDFSRHELRCLIRRVGVQAQADQPGARNIINTQRRQLVTRPASAGSESSAKRPLNFHKRSLNTVCQPAAGQIAATISVRHVKKKVGIMTYFVLQERWNFGARQRLTSCECAVRDIIQRGNERSILFSHSVSGSFQFHHVDINIFHDAISISSSAWSSWVRACGGHPQQRPHSGESTGAWCLSTVFFSRHVLCLTSCVLRIPIPHQDSAAGLIVSVLHFCARPTQARISVVLSTSRARIYGERDLMRPFCARSFRRDRHPTAALTPIAPTDLATRCRLGAVGNWKRRGHVDNMQPGCRRCALIHARRVD